MKKLHVIRPQQTLGKVRHRNYLIKHGKFDEQGMLIPASGIQNTKLYNSKPSFKGCEPQPRKKGVAGTVVTKGV